MHVNDMCHAQEQPPPTWELELSLEMTSYQFETLAEDAYCPSPLDDKQLRKATLEFKQTVGA